MDLTVSSANGDGVGSLANMHACMHAGAACSQELDTSMIILTEESMKIMSS